MATFIARIKSIIVYGSLMMKSIVLFSSLIDTHSQPKKLVSTVVGFDIRNDFLFLSFNLCSSSFSF